MIEEIIEELQDELVGEEMHIEELDLLMESKGYYSDFFIDFNKALKDGHRYYNNNESELDDVEVMFDNLRNDGSILVTEIYKVH